MKIVRFDAVIRSFSNLSSSDKRALIILCAFLVTALMYFITVQSFKYRNENIAAVKNNRDLMILLFAAERRFTSAKSKIKVEGMDLALLTLVSSTAKERQITFKRFQPEGDNVIKLWMENVNFNNLLIWLHDIDKKNGISVQEISVEQSKDEGFVDVRLTLQR